jgi:hypothetical protein
MILEEYYDAWSIGALVECSKAVPDTARARAAASALQSQPVIELHSLSERFASWIAYLSYSRIFYSSPGSYGSLLREHPG